MDEPPSPPAAKTDKYGREMSEMPEEDWKREQQLLRGEIFELPEDQKARNRQFWMTDMELLLAQEEAERVKREAGRAKEEDKT